MLKIQVLMNDEQVKIGLKTANFSQISRLMDKETKETPKKIFSTNFAQIKLFRMVSLAPHSYMPRPNLQKHCYLKNGRKG